MLPLLATSVQKNYNVTLRKHLLPIFADMPLRDMNVITLQKYFSGMKANYPTAVEDQGRLGERSRKRCPIRAANHEPACRRATPSA